MWDFNGLMIFVVLHYEHSYHGRLEGALPSVKKNGSERDRLTRLQFELDPTENVSSKKHLVTHNTSSGLTIHAKVIVMVFKLDRTTSWRGYQFRFISGHGTLWNALDATEKHYTNDSNSVRNPSIYLTYTHVLPTQLREAISLPSSALSTNRH